MIVIVDYNMGNIGSIINMIRKAGGEAIVSGDITEIKRAGKLILPGVGSFDQAMEKIHKFCLTPVLNEKVVVDKIPILGICLGMQLFTKYSEEGDLPGLGWLDAKTVRFKFERELSQLKVPHMGWNTIEIKQENPIFRDIFDEPRFYFVHSYHVICQNEEDILSVTKYGYDFVSTVRRGNIYGTQFHPEKSHKFGLRLIKNFVELV